MNVDTIVDTDFVIQKVGSHSHAFMVMHPRKYWSYSYFQQLTSFKREILNSCHSGVYYILNQFLWTFDNKLLSKLISASLRSKLYL